MTRRTLPFITTLVLMLAWSAAAPATAATAFPESIPLPSGFYPEGIAVGRGHDAYVGSLQGGAVYEVDLRTGEGAVLADGVDGRVLAGLSFDRRSGLVWGVGVDAGSAVALAFDSRTGEVAAEVTFPVVPFVDSFVNDLVVTREALYVTDSFSDVLWTVPLTNRGLPAGPARALPLSGDFTLVGPGDVPPGALPINLNGIAATADGETLLAIHTTLGVVYRIDPGTGVATEVDLQGASLPWGDGIVLHGTTLYVVQNFLNQVAVVDLAPDLRSGEVVRTITSDLFRVPTTAAVFGSSLYLVNARFDAGFPPVLGGPVLDLDYEVVAVRR